MSRTLIRTALKGYEGPLPVDTNRLRDTLDLGSFSGDLLNQAYQKVPGHIRQFRPRTDDGYSWFWALLFRVGGGEVAILIPWSQDWAKKDGSQADRAIAVYTSGTVQEGEVAELLTKLDEACKGLVKQIQA
jgi:hypothetical protein